MNILMMLLKDILTPDTIATTGVLITPKHHSMQIKQAVTFCHGA